MPPVRYNLLWELIYIDTDRTNINHACVVVDTFTSPGLSNQYVLSIQGGKGRLSE